MTPVKPYQINLNEDVVVFVNGFKARSITGFFYLWTRLPQMIRSAKKAAGCFECIPALVGPFQVIMVSYWKHHKHLNQYVKSEVHQSYMSFVYRYPKALALFNETYHPHKSGLYHNEPTGLAKQEQRR